MRIAMPALFLMCLLLSGCGQKGPLVLPEDPAAEATQQEHANAESREENDFE